MIEIIQTLIKKMVVLYNQLDTIAGIESDEKAEKVRDFGHLRAELNELNNLKKVITRLQGKITVKRFKKRVK